MKHTNLGDEIYTEPKKKDWGEQIAIGLGIVFIGYLLAHLVVAVTFGNIAHAQEVTASVSCNETNRLYSSSCMDWGESDVENKENTVGKIMGIPFYTHWLSPNRMLFWTPDAYWYVTKDGIEK